MTFETIRGWLFYGNIHIGFVTVGLLSSTYHFFQIDLNVPLLILGFVSTFILYQLDHAFLSSREDLINEPKRIAWQATHQHSVKILTGIAFLIGCIFLVFLSFKTILVCSLLLIPVGFHLIPQERYSLKHHVDLKILIMTSVWVYGAVCIPLIQTEDVGTLKVCLFVLYRMCLILPNLIWCNWADVEGDTAVGYSVATWLLKEQRLVVFTISLLTFGMAIWILGFKQFDWEYWGAFDVLAYLSMILVIIYKRKTESFKFLLDSSLLWLLLPSLGFL